MRGNYVIAIFSIEQNQNRQEHKAQKRSITLPQTSQKAGGPKRSAKIVVQNQLCSPVIDEPIKINNAKDPN
jgi:hypothetical protein